MKKRIIAVHLLNDRSGSPLILRQALDVLQRHHEVILYTATPSGDGFLNDIPFVQQRKLFYRHNNNKYATLFYYLLSQFLLFWRLVFTLRSSDTVYVNTLLPFGAALAGFVRRTKIVYHVQEVSLKPVALKSFLSAIADRTAHTVLFVSHYVAGHYDFCRAEKKVVYNCLPDSFIRRAQYVRRVNLNLPFTVTMLCSLKAYKGVYHFINIARRLKSLRFVLVLNASQKDVDHFKRFVDVPDNCVVHPAQKNTVPFYEEAHVVCNLSKPDGWVETFGMTLLEAMHCGRPVICPNVGGVLEVVQSGVEGYAINSSDESRIVSVLRELSTDITRYVTMSQAAADRADAFSRQQFEKGIEDAFMNESQKMQKMNTWNRFFPESGNRSSCVSA